MGSGSHQGSQVKKDKVKITNFKQLPKMQILQKKPSKRDPPEVA